MRNAGVVQKSITFEWGRKRLPRAVVLFHPPPLPSTTFSHAPPTPPPPRLPAPFDGQLLFVYNVPNSITGVINNKTALAFAPSLR